MTRAERRLTWIAAVQAALEEAQRALVRPSAQSIDGMLPRLEQAAKDLQSIEPAPELRPVLAALGSQVRRARALLDTAGAWHAGWARVLYGAACGYAANGQPSAPPPGRSFSLEA